MAEGLARDVVRAVQKGRRDADLDVSDRIALVIGGISAAVAAAWRHADLIKAETLATALTVTDDPVEVARRPAWATGSRWCSYWPVTESRPLVLGTLVTMIRRRVVARGRVQGVFYRDSCRRVPSDEAAGWVSNRPDGGVEAVFEGPAAQVDALVKWARRGPPQRTVALEVTEEGPVGEAGFTVR